MTLYHYTTADGLHGIVASKTIWASDYRFMNDSTEFNYGLAIFDEVLESNFFRDNYADLGEMVRNFRRPASTFVVLITSFCQHPDLLSQWKGYNSATGYAIGFNRDWLNQNAEHQGFRLIPVVYDAAEQRRLVRERIGLLKTLLAERRASRTEWEVAREWWPQMLHTITALKSEHFKEEDEYRLVKIEEGWTLGIKTRVAPQGLVPYKPVKLDAMTINNPLLPPNNVGIECIIVGPALANQQLAAVDALLASHHMRLSIQKSDIPYLPK
jgi:hypothetical protein